MLKSPFPYFGGKSRIAREVWKRFGGVKGYVEPFFGSGAVLLSRPMPFGGVETVNDADGMICNFWRAVKADPDAVAGHADWPSNECDLIARHAWLVERKASLQERLKGDPEFFDAKIAGWWCWGMACWIGHGFCSGDGPWRVQEVDEVKKLVHLGDAGRGVQRKLVHLSSAGQGVQRKLVYPSSAGRGGDPGAGEQGILEWMRALADRLARVRVCCGDWTRVCGGDSGDALNHFFVGGEPCGVFLDPPYADTANRSEVYSVDSMSVAHDVCQWAIEHGDDKRLRIALCGYDGEHEMPETWECLRWKSAGGYSGVADRETQAKLNAFRECVWFSQHCRKVEKVKGFDL